VSEPRVLIVVPTLGTRPSLLDQCLASIGSQSVPAEILLVAPEGSTVATDLAAMYGARLLPDPGSLAAAINLGAASAGPHIEYLNWLGDDDLLEPDSLARTVACLEANPQATLAYGACRYIDEAGQELWVSRAGPWATRILAWGPDLIPQPGMLVRHAAWIAVGGIDESYKFAFDLDLLLKLKAIGPLLDVGEILSSFRWHGDSLTVGDRTTSLRESERARRASLSPIARSVAWIWERPVRGATRLAAAEVERRARRLR
jgi:GT2 family glycosyltransferase